jgi:uncharacterized protein YceH (UPF0502 family)
MGTIQPLQKAEARVLGVLIEKSLTTPDGYPLSLNALVNGCNQKSNRDPMMALDEKSVEEAVRDLRMNRLAIEVSNRSARVIKYRHKVEERLELDTQSVAILAELMLRGPQSAGELRGRASRMASIESLGELDGLLRKLIERQMVVQLSPLPGSRAIRYMQLVAPDLHDPGSAPTAAQPTPAAAPPTAADSGAVVGISSASPAPPGRTTVHPTSPTGAAPVPPPPPIPAPSGDLVARVSALEEQVESLTALVAQLRRRMGPPVER